ncbi:MAG: hypothetical protein K0A98_08315 [Trueperaceae bacterium]|nr:hypothetical protein [Trueperaceae bacterium]
MPKKNPTGPEGLSALPFLANVSTAVTPRGRHATLAPIVGANPACDAPSCFARNSRTVAGRHAVASA